MDKIQRATEIHRSMTPHQMALRIVEMEDESSAAIDAMNMAREAINEGTAKLAEYNARLDGYAKRITELQDALELAEEAVRAKHVAVPEGWKLVPVEPTVRMVSNGVSAQKKKLYNYALSGSWPPIGHGIDAAYQAMLAAAPKMGGE